MIIAKGAEATISLSGDVVTKDRIAKGYRIPQLDEALREKRNRTEAALMREARRRGVLVPQILEETDFSIRMEFLEGDRVKDIINEHNCIGISATIAETVARLHNGGIIHGDLTTSNVIIKGSDIYFIDFGLGCFSSRAEDKATDLHLLHEALESTHFDILEKAWSTVLAAYKNASGGNWKVIKTLAEIEKRGRYRER